MNRERKIELMMECISEYASTIPEYMEENYQKAINMAFRKIEQAEKEEPQTDGAVRSPVTNN